MKRLRSPLFHCSNDTLVGSDKGSPAEPNSNCPTHGYTSLPMADKVHRTSPPRPSRMVWILGTIKFKDLDIMAELMHRYALVCRKAIQPRPNLHSLFLQHLTINNNTSSRDRTETRLDQTFNLDSSLAIIAKEFELLLS
jgi:hypothetical protein